MNSYTMGKLNKWREKRPVREIKTNLINVTHREHLTTEAINFNREINRMRKYPNGKVIPIVVRKTKKGYSLLFGLKQLIIAKVLNLDIIPAVVTECSREELIELLKKSYDRPNTIHIDIDKIMIQEKFQNSQPSNDKVIFKTRAIENGIIAPITVNEDYILTDGYITYLILKEMGRKSIGVQIY